MRLLNFPNKSQLADVNEANRLFDCVPTCIADALTYLTGKDYDAGHIKDLVYTPGYVGGTAAYRYIDYCASQGVKLFDVQGNGAALVKAIRAQLALGHASIGTEPDPYADPTLGWSHAIIFYAMDEPNGTLTARDPYSTQDVVLSDVVWASMLEFSEIWPLALLEEYQIMSTLDRLKAAGWKDDPAADRLTAPNGLYFQKGFRAHVIAAEYYDPADCPLELEHTQNPMEVSNPTITPGTQQICRMTVWQWNAQRGVFKQWVGQELLALRKIVATLQSGPQSTLPTAILHDLTDATQKIEGALGEMHDAINRHA